MLARWYRHSIGDIVESHSLIWVFWYGGGSLVGAGIFHLFSRWWLGVLASVPILVITIVLIRLRLFFGP